VLRPGLATSWNKAWLTSASVDDDGAGMRRNQPAIATSALGRIRMRRREIAVYHLVEQQMTAGPALDHPPLGIAGRTSASIPAGPRADASRQSAVQFCIDVTRARAVRAVVSRLCWLQPARDDRLYDVRIIA
jgi:hypothetical protein